MIWIMCLGTSATDPDGYSYGEHELWYPDRLVPVAPGSLKIWTNGCFEYRDSL